MKSAQVLPYGHLGIFSDTLEKVRQDVRTNPTWYCEGLPEVMTLFSQTFSDRPPNLHLLPSFATPGFESDGGHLSAYSGLE